MKGRVTEHDFDAIERYLRHEITGAERFAFEQRLHDDAELYGAVQEFDALIKGVEMAVMKEKMNTFHEQLDNPEMPRPEPGHPLTDEGRHEEHIYNNKHTVPTTARKTSEPKNTVFPNTRMFQHISLTQFMVAASFLLLLAISAWWFATQRPPHLKLYAAYFSPDPGLITPMSADADFIFYDAMVDYKLHDYDKAISKWRSLLYQKPENDTLNYFIGVAELARGDAETAIPFLLFITAKRESVFLDDAFFYLGMAHLKHGNLTAAAESLEQTGNQRGKAVLYALKKKDLSKQ